MSFIGALVSVIDSFIRLCQGLANSTDNIKFSSEGNSGILGLAFPSEASMSGMTVLQSIFCGLADPYFTIILGSKLNVNSPSSFTLGQLDRSYATDFSAFFSIPVSKAGANDYTYWKIPLLYVTINSSRLSLSPSSVQGIQGSQIAVLDTGTTLALGPTRDVQAFWSSVGSAARNDPITGTWQVRCEKALIVGFVFGQGGSYKEFLLDPADISWEEGQSKNGWCLGGVQANDEVCILFNVPGTNSSRPDVPFQVDSGDWLLGDVFLRVNTIYYCDITFDNLFQNVYSLYHAANSSSGPWIGLISTTNRDNALTAFRQSRGPDLNSLSSPVTQISSVVASGIRYKLLCGISTLCGFIGGAVLVTLFRARHGLSAAFGKRKQK